MKKPILKTKLRFVASLLLASLVPVCVAAEPSQPNKAESSSGKTKNFLFIGNSFTMRHQLPSIFAELAQEGLAGTSVKTDIVGYGGKNLFQHWELYRSYNRLNLNSRNESELQNEINELTKLRESKVEPDFYTAFWQELSGNEFYKKFTPKNYNNKWEADRDGIKGALNHHKRWLSLEASAPEREFDYVVLQSWLDVTDDPSTGYFKYAAKFSEAAKGAGAQTVLYLTAPYAQNQTPVTEAVAKERAVGECKAAMAFSKATGAIVVPVPLAITLAQASTDPVARTLTFRYQNDGHPNQTMAYLTACTLYAAVYGKSPEGLMFNKVTETKSQNIHGEAVKPNDKNEALSSQANPDGGPLEKVFTDEERLFLQRTAWQSVEAFGKGEF